MGHAISIWKKTKRSLLFFCTAFSLLGQNRIRIQGYVSDETDAEVLIGATVRVGDDGVITDEHGHYSLLLNRGTYPLVFGYIGYADTTLLVSAVKDTVLHVRLRRNLELAAATVLADGSRLPIQESLGQITANTNLLASLPAVLGEGDVLKAVQYLPGVQGTVTGTADILVRGGGYDENLFLMDGVPMYNTSHLLGLFSAFAPESVRQVSLYKSGFPARYGGRVSSVVDVRTKDGDAAHTRGFLRLGILNDAVSVNGPILKDKLLYSVGIRGIHTTWIAPILKAVRCPLSYGFYDVNAKLSWRGPHDRVSLSAYAGADDFYYSGPEQVSQDKGKSYIGRQDFGLKWKNNLLALRWNHLSSTGLRTETQLSWSQYDCQSRFLSHREYVDSTEIYQSRFASHVMDFHANFLAGYRLRQSLVLESGCEAGFQMLLPMTAASFNHQLSEPVQAAWNSGRPVFSAALFADGTWNTADWSLRSGLRVVFLTVPDRMYKSLEPRISVHYKGTSALHWSIDYARTTQHLHCLRASSLSLPTDMWVPVTNGIKPVVADQVSSGISFDFPWDLQLTIEAYYKYRRNILSYRNGVSFIGSTNNWERMVIMEDGRSCGLEFMIRYASGPVTGWLSYVLAKAERYAPDSGWYPDRFDRRHSISANLNWVIREGIRLDAAWMFQSGPMVSLGNQVSVVASPTSEPYRLDVLATHRNGCRLPPSHQLSLNATFTIQHRKHGKSIWRIGVYNLYNAMNPDLYYLERPNLEANPVLHIITIFPVLPSASYTYAF